MQHSTTEQLTGSMTSIIATEDLAAAAEAGVSTKDRLLGQLEQLGKLERLARVALTECVVELRRERAIWAEIGETYGTTLQSAHARWHEAEVQDQALDS